MVGHVLSAAAHLFGNAPPDSIPSTTSTSVPGGGPTTFLSGDNSFAGVWGVLGFGVIIVLLVVCLVLLDRMGVRRTITRLVASGQSTSEFSTPGHVTSARQVAPVAAISGPTVLVVGQSETFTFVPGPTPVDPSTIAWSVSGAGTIDTNATGETVTLKATQPGRIELAATPDGADPVRQPIQVLSSERTALSSLGEGWASVTVSIAILSVTGALAIAGVLNAQAAAGVIGSLVTYAIVRGATPK